MQRVIEHWHRNKGFARYVASKGVTALTTLCISGLVSRSLGPGLFGYLMSASVIAMVLSAIADGNSMARGISKWQDDQPQFAGWLAHAVALRLVAGAISLSLMTVIAFFAGWTPYMLLSAGWCFFLLCQPFRLLEIRLIASENFELLSKASLWSAAGMLALGAILFALGWTRSMWVSLILLILPVLGSSPYLMIMSRSFPVSRGTIQPELLKREAALTFSFGTTQGMSMLLDALPYVVIPRYYGLAVLGWYAAASKLIQTYTQGIALLLPFALTKLNRNPHGLALKYCFYALLIGALSWLGFIFLGTQAIVLVNSAAFSKASTLFVPLAGLIVAIPLGQLCMGKAGLTSRPKLPFFSVLTTFLLLGIFCLVLKPESAHGFLAFYSIAILITTLLLSFLIFEKFTHPKRRDRSRQGES